MRDSAIKSLKLFVLYYPAKVLFKLSYVIGVLTGLLQYDYHNGKQAAQRVYDKLKDQERV